MTTSLRIPTELFEVSKSGDGPKVSRGIVNIEPVVGMLIHVESRSRFRVLSVFINEQNDKAEVTGHWV